MGLFDRGPQGPAGPPGKTGAPGKSGDISLVASVNVTSLTTPKNAGARTIDFTEFPSEYLTGARTVRFKAIIANALHSAAYYTEVRLYDVTHDVAIASATLDNEDESDRGIAKEFTSPELTIGENDGDLRSDDASTVYQVQYRAVGTVTPEDRAELMGARLVVTYEA